MSRWRLLLPALLAVTMTHPASARAEWRHLGPVSSLERTDAVVTLHCGAADVRIGAVTDHVVRVRLGPGGTFGRDFSWAVQDLQPKGRFTSIEETSEQISLSAGGITVLVRRDPCRLTITDADGRRLTVDDIERGMSWREGTTGDPGASGSAVGVWQDLADEVAIYGLAEKAGPLDKSGQTLCMWNTDAFAYGATTDPLYMSVPFFIVGQEGGFHGVFFDNPWRTSFDFGRQERGVLSFGAEGGELNYYVIAGPGANEVIRRYTDLVGRMELPPKWAVGYHQCRYSYFPESRVREVANTFRAKKIPCDTLFFDIHYMDGYRCFTWDPRRFPDPKQLMSDLNNMGFHTVAIIDPGIKVEPGYSVYDSGTSLGAWLTGPEGEAYVGRVWPGACVFPDFTNSAVRDWWSDLFPPFLEQCGLDGIWNDMNEPADFDGPNHSVPLDLRHHNEGQAESHLACHNIYGMQMARATKEGIDRARPGRRAFTLTRASYAGGQRYGASWTGDNISSWEHMKMSIPMVLNMGVSGMPFAGPDIGGFIRGASPDLFARWIQFGALLPFARTHTGSGNPDQEPWSFGAETEAVARKALERRYELMPYLYTLFEEASRTGMPIVRPLWMDFPKLEGSLIEGTFMLGREIFVAPNLNPGRQDINLRLPPGIWFDGNTGLIHGGQRWIRVPGDLQVLPHFVRAGAIIPMQSPVQSTTFAPDERLIVDAWPFGESTGTLYEDDGETLAYLDGEYRRTDFWCVADGDEVTVTVLAPQGTYEPPPRSPLVRFHGLRGRIERVVSTVGDATELIEERTTPSPSAAIGRPAEFFHDSAANTWLVRMHSDKGERQQVRIMLSQAPEQSQPPVAIEFDAPSHRFESHRGCAEPIYENGVAQLTVRESWEPILVLPRLAVPAAELPVLKVRMMTQHTSRISMRFATEERPDVLEGEGLLFDVVADGALHDYAFDLAEATGGGWTGTVYRIELGLREGSIAGEVVHFDRIAFERRP